MISHRKRKPLVSRTGSILPEQEPIYSQSYIQESETTSFQEGDQVVHKTMEYLNSGLPLRVLDTEGRQVLCSYFDHLTTVPALGWYDKNELQLIGLTTEDVDYPNYG